MEERADEFNKYFTNEHIEFAGKHIKLCSELLIIRKCNLRPQLNTTIYSSKWLKLKLRKNMVMLSIVLGVEQAELPYAVSRI